MSRTEPVARVLSLPVRIFCQNLGYNFSYSFNYRPFHRRDCFVVWFHFAVCYCHSYLSCNPQRISDYRLLRRPWQTEVLQAMQSLCTRLTLKIIQKDLICVNYCIVYPRNWIANIHMHSQNYCSSRTTSGLPAQVSLLYVTTICCHFLSACL